MKTKDVFELLEEVYRRRRKVAEAKLRSAEDSLRSKEEHLAQLKEAAVSKEAANESEISNMMQSADRPRHFLTLTNAIRARQIQHADELLLLRYNTLRTEEDLDGLLEERNQQRRTTGYANRKHSMFEDFLEEEIAAEEVQAETADEEASHDSHSRPRV